MRGGISVAKFEDIRVLAMQVSSGLTVPWRYELLSGGRRPWQNADALGLRVRGERGTQNQGEEECSRGEHVCVVAEILRVGLRVEK